MFLLGNYQHRIATTDNTGRMLTTYASALRLPVLRPEDVLIQHDAHGQKVLLGEGSDGVVRRPCLDVRHAAFCTLGDMHPLVSCFCSKPFTSVFHAAHRDHEQLKEICVAY